MTIVLQSLEAIEARVHVLTVRNRGDDFTMATSLFVVWKRLVKVCTSATKDLLRELAGLEAGNVHMEVAIDACAQFISCWVWPKFGEDDEA